MQETLKLRGLIDSFKKHSKLMTKSLRHLWLKKKCKARKQEFTFFIKKIEQEDTNR
jgi:hypothetical protein